MSEIFSGFKGQFELKESIEGFRALLSCEGDDFPESAFYMKGNL